MPTVGQIQAFTVKAKQAGFSDAQISAEISRKTQEEVQRSNIQASPVAPTPQATQAPVATPAPQPEKKSFVRSFVDALVDNGIKYSKYVGEAGYQGGRYIIDPTFRKAVNGGDLTGEEAQKLNAMPDTMFVDKEKIKDRASAITSGLKATAAGMSYAVPGAAGVKGAVAAGAAAGALNTASQDNFGKDGFVEGVKDAATGAVAGGALSGALTGVAKGINAIKPSKVGAALQKTGEEVKLSTYVKGMGAKPIAREGGNKLLINMQKTGIKPGNSEQVLEQATRIVQDNSGKIFKATQQLDDAGVKISVSDITGALENELKNAKSVMTKKPIEDVLKVLKTDFAKKKTLTPTEIYLLKAEYGPLGSWSKLSSQVEQKQAEVWRDVYVKMNSLLDDTLKANGFDEFRSINDAVHTAIQASQYATRVGNIAPSRSAFGLGDLLIGGSAFTSAGLPATVAALAIKKTAEAPVTAQLAGSAIQNVGKVIEKLPQTSLPAAGVVGNIISGNVGSAVANPQSEAGTVDNNANQTYNEANKTPEYNAAHSGNTIAQNDPAVINGMQQDIPDPFRGMTKQQVLRLAVASGAKKSDLEEIAYYYDIVSEQKGGVISEETRKIAGELRNEYISRTKENGYIQAINGFRKVNTTPASPAGDLSLIFAYMKMLDPTSVVRESEQELAQNATSLPGRLQNYAMQVANGKKLNDAQRQEFRDAAGVLFEQYSATQSQIDNLYSGFAGQYGVDPKLLGIGALNADQVVK